MCVNQTLEAALDLIELGLAVYPMCCYTTSDGQKKKCPPKGHHGVKEATRDEQTARGWWNGDNDWQLAVATGQVSDGVLVIDIDGPEHGVNGEASLAAFEAKHGKLPETVTALTGGGGRHLYYRVPIKLKKRTGDASPLRGVDFLAEGAGAIAPPSRHPNGTLYRWADGLSPREHEIVELGPGSPIVELLSTASKKTVCCASLPDIITEPGRNDALYRYGCSLRARGLGDEEVRSSLVAVNAERCQPPLCGEEVNSIVRSVLKCEPGASARRSTPTLNELVRLIESRGIPMGFDRFTRCAVKTGALPWDSTTDNREWSENDTLRLRALLEDEEGVRDRCHVEDAIRLYADNHGFDSLETMLRVLQWDGTLRAGFLFATYLGAEFDEYTYEVERLLLREMVARAFNPGVKADYVPVLVGPGGTGKSTMARSLAISDALFTDAVPDLSDIKLTGEAVAGKWVVELSELSAVRGKGLEAVKAAISRQRDRYRPAYARKTEEMPRRCVFIGTTNCLGFIADRTSGARRFLPVKCGVTNPERSPFGPELAEDARQAVAEVVAEYLSSPDGDFSLMLPPEVEAAAAQRRDAARVDDPRIGQIQGYLDSYTGDRVCTTQLATEALGIDRSEVNRRSTHIGRELAALLDDEIVGWKRGTKMLCGAYGKQLCWIRES